MKRKRKWTAFLLPIAFLLGLGMLLYPAVSDHWNSQRQTRAVRAYAEAATSVDAGRSAKLWEDATAYNRSLAERVNPFALTEQQQDQYSRQLILPGSSAMGYLDIPILQATFPVYHGTSEAVLQSAVGHIEWTSLPVGGRGTHSALSSHRGLPSSQLFTHLDRLVLGDVFILRVLNETLVYEVDQIRIVEPEDAEPLQVVEGQDLCTLVTCTPYGINTHRLLVRGHRVSAVPSADVVRLTAEAVQIRPAVVAPFLALPLLLILWLLLMVSDHLVKRPRKKDDKDAANQPL